MIGKVIELKKFRDAEPYCANPECSLHHDHNADANARNQSRKITRKQYVGIHGKGVVWFCSICAAAIERAKLF